LIGSGGTTTMSPSRGGAVAGAGGAHDDDERHFREWAAEQRPGDGTAAFGDGLERDLGRAYERIDSLLDEAEQLDGVGDELEAANGAHLPRAKAAAP
jgi:hypothetical protein